MVGRTRIDSHDLVSIEYRLPVEEKFVRKAFKGWDRVKVSLAKSDLSAISFARKIGDEKHLNLRLRVTSLFFSNLSDESRL